MVSAQDKVMESTFTRFPAAKLGDARAELTKAHARLVRAAARAGQDAPAAPELIVQREYTVSRCHRHDCEFEGSGDLCPSGRAPSDPAYHAALDRCAVLHRRLQLVDLELRVPAPKLAGWEFLAVVEPLVGGNLIRGVPGAVVAEGELDAWRSGAIRCDHCQAARRRVETFVLRADGSDAAIPAGSYKQVGRQCLQDFLGGLSPTAIIAQLGWPEIVRRTGDADGEGGGWDTARLVFEPLAFLSWCAAASRLDGFVTKKQAQESAARDALGLGRKRATADVVSWLLDEEPRGEAGMVWREERERLMPTDGDVERAHAVLAWAKIRNGAADYEQNLRLVASQQSIEPKHAGLLASAVASYERALGENSKRAARGPSEHYGAIGERVELAVTVERVFAIESKWGTAAIVTYRDAAGRTFLWRTGARHGEVGREVRLRGTVKRHSEYRGEKQTELTRCALIAGDRIEAPHRSG